MQKILSTTGSWFKSFFAKEATFPLLVLASLVSAALILAFWIDGWTAWLLGFLIIAAWMPLVLATMKKLSLTHRWLAFLYLLLISQTAHMIEHLAQMVELHLLGWAGPKAAGIIGFLNIEWVHLVWNSWVLLAICLLLVPLRHNKWLWGLFIFAIYHEIEHIYIVSIYVRTGIAGNPGLLARGGLIGGGLPIARPDLHAIYAVLETAMILMIYLQESKRVLPARQKQGVALALDVEVQGQS
jgi:hypothetical protein